MVKENAPNRVYGYKVLVLVWLVLGIVPLDKMLLLGFKILVLLRVLVPLNYQDRPRSS